MREELFRSDNIAVRRVGARGGTLIVTFGSYTSDPSLDRPGFGEEFLERSGIDAIHVVNRHNRWYQHPERPAALALIAERAREYDRAVTYGSSMGGYAALRYAAACGADIAIAISPQYSVDPRVTPWEERWQADVVKVDFAEPAFVAAARQYIFYDPRVTPDDRHVAMFAEAGPTVRIALPFAGHPVGALLVETGALQSALRDIVAGTFDPVALRREVRAHKRRSQHHHFILARRAAPRRPDVALRLLERAAAIEPESHIVSAQGELLDRLHRHAEAAPLHRAAVARTPNNALAWMAYAAHLEAIGNPRAAAEALRSAARDKVGAMLLRVRILQARMWLRRHRLGMIDRGFERVIRRVERSSRHAAVLRWLGARLR